MVNVLGVIAPIFILICFGFLSVKIKLLSTQDYPALSTFVMSISFPCLLITKLSTLDFSQAFRWDIFSIYTFCSLALAFTAISFFEHVLDRAKGQARLQGGMGVPWSMSGFIGYPVLILAFDNPPMIAFSTAIIVENLILMPIVIFLMEQSSLRQEGLNWRRVGLSICKRIVLNPIMISIFSAIVLSTWDIQLPAPLFDAMALMGTSAAPLAVFAIGVALVGKNVQGNITDIAWTSVGKLIIHPALIALTCFMIVDEFRDPIVLAIILLSASPMPSMYSIFGMKYGLSSVTASTLTVATFISLLTISGWILILGI